MVNTTTGTMATAETAVAGVKDQAVERAGKAVGANERERYEYAKGLVSTSRTQLISNESSLPLPLVLHTIR